MISIFLKVTVQQVSNGENTVRTLSVEEIGDWRIGAKSRAKGQQDGSQADGIQRFGLEKV